MQPHLSATIKKTLIRRKKDFVKGFLFVLFGNSLLILNPLLFRRTVAYAEGDATTLGIALFSLVLLSIAAISALCKYWMRITFITISREEEQNIRSRLFERIQQQSMAFFDKFGTGELLSRLTNDISAWRDVLGPGIMYPTFFVTMAIPGLLALFYISPSLANFAFVPIFAIIIVNYIVRTKIKVLLTQVQELLGKMSSMAQESFSSIRILKGYLAEESNFDAFAREGKKLCDINVRLSFSAGMLFPFFVFLTRLATLGFVFLSAGMILKGWGELETADFVSFMWIQSYIFFPVIMLGWLLPVYQRGAAAWGRLFEIYNEPIEVKERGKLAPLKGPIHIQNLTFFYPGTKNPALNHLSIAIDEGQFVGIAGPIGSGKSTLLRLLNREYEVPDRAIFFGGNEIHDYSLEAFHQQIAAVEQAPFLFSRSILHNIALGVREAPLDAVREAASFAGIEGAIEQFPEQWKTIVGERGVTLSGGEKQRVAIARALLVSRSILLLDDIFSAVDAKTEGEIIKNLKEKLQGKTVILVTHRTRVLEKMDKIFYFSQGKVAESGTFQELMEHSGPIKALVDLERLSE